MYKFYIQTFHLQNHSALVQSKETPQIPIVTIVHLHCSYHSPSIVIIVHLQIYIVVADAVYVYDTSFTFYTDQWYYSR